MKRKPDNDMKVYVLLSVSDFCPVISIISTLSCHILACLSAVLAPSPNILEVCFRHGVMSLSVTVACVTL